MNHLRMSIVDDEKAHYELIMRAAKKEFPHVVVDYYADGESFIECWKQNNPDIMIVDYMLPGISGLELLQKLKGENSNVPVIMVTGQGDEHIAVEAIKLGAFDYLVKSGNFFNLIPGIIRKAVEHRQTQEKLQEARQRFRAIFDYGDIGVSLISKDGQFFECNQKFCEMLGYDDSELKSMTITDITHPADISEELMMHKRLWSGKLNTYQREKRFIHKNGKVLWVISTAVAVFDGSGKIKYHMGLVQDITQRKEHEETIRELYNRLISTQEIERKKIAHKLHDDLGQTLTVMKIGLDQLKSQWPPSSREVLERINGLIELTRKTTETIRTLSYHLRPPVLDDLGLIAAIKSLISEIEKQKDITIEFNAFGFKERLDAEIELTLFRIIEEGLTNIIKHSKASAAKVCLIQSFPKVVGIIEDNGKGFDKEKILGNSVSRKGLGLITIKERIRFFKGSFEINPVPKGGTSIKIEIPLDKVTHE